MDYGTTPEFSRNPCPDRIVEDAGMGFAMGALGGSAFHFVKGLYNSPNGHRLAGGATAARMKAAGVGGSFAVWGCLYSVFDCGLVYARNKEDPWNSIAAGSCTGGLLSLRQGLRTSAKSAAIGAGFFALVEGANIMVNRFLVLPPEPEYLPPLENPGVGLPALENPAADGLPPPIAAQELPVPGPTGFFRGLFGRKKEHKVEDKLEVLELDMPSAPVPSFD